MSLVFLLSLGCGGGADCTQSAWYLDDDGDGHGGTERVDACEAPAGYTAQSTDCDDADADVHPDAPEVCDLVDNDCDGGVDDDATDMLSVFVDRDGDGFGDPSALVEVCALDDGLSETGTDCDDSEADVFPGAVEVCDGLDNDCDPATTEGLSYPGDFASLAEATDQMRDGDRLCIQPGTYTEAVSWSDKELHIAGSGVDRTVLLAPDEDAAALSLLRGDGSSVAGLSVRGLLLEESADLQLQDVLVTGGESCAGSCGGVTLDATTATFTDVDVEQVHVRGSTGDVAILALANRSELTWMGGSFAENSVVVTADDTERLDLAGGIQVYQSGLHAVGVSFDDNTVSLALNTETTSATLAFNEGLVHGYQADVILEDGTMSGNTVSCTGDNPMGRALVTCAGLWQATYALVELSGMRIDGNSVDATATYDADASLTSSFGSTVRLQDVTLQGNGVSNAAESSGSCVLLDAKDAPTELLRVRFLENDISCGIGDVYGLINDHSGGGTYAENVTIAANTLTGPRIGFGLIRVDLADLTLLNSTIHDNELVFQKAFSGVVFHNGPANTHVLRNNSISGNQLGVTSSGYPAAAVLWGYAIRTVDHNSFYGNSSSSGIQFTDHAGERDVLGTDGNAALTPDYVDAEAFDFSLGGATQMVDMGSPDILDVDGSRSDIGVTGGPGAQ